MATAASGQVQVRVATWNIENFDGADMAQFNAARDVLLRINADVVCVQEMDSLTAFNNLAAAAGYPFRVLASAAGDIDTNPDWSGVMSKYALIDPVTLTSVGLSGDPEANDLTRNFIRASVLVPGAANPLTIAGNHWKASNENTDEFRRSIESMRAMQTVAAFNSLLSPFFVVGDMNDDITEPPDSPAIFSAPPSGLPGSFALGSDIALPILNSAFFPLQNASGTANLNVINALQKDGSDVTFPASMRRLDYIWRSDANTLMGSQVYDSADEGLPGGLPLFGAPLPAGTSAIASDHLPVFADLRITASGLPADFNGNGLVSLAEYTAFRPCLAGPQSAPELACEPADLEGDGDVDLRDAGILFDTYTGP